MDEEEGLVKRFAEAIALGSYYPERVHLYPHRGS
jgi:hypothetical protein